MPPVNPRLAWVVEPKPEKKYSGARRKPMLGVKFSSPMTLALAAKVLLLG